MNGHGVHLVPFPLQKATTLGVRQTKWMSNLLKTNTASAVISTLGTVGLGCLKILWLHRLVSPEGRMITE